MSRQEPHTEFQVQAPPALLAFIFILLLIFPAADHFIGLTDPPSMEENREPAPLPKFDIEKLDPFPEQFEAWWNDNARSRDEMLDLYRRIKLDVFHEAPFPEKGALGKDGFLFWQKYLECYRTPNPFSEADLDSIRSGLERQQAYYAERGIRFYVMVPPAKANIYPEKLPGSVIRLGQKTRWEQVLEHMQGSSVPIIDLLPVLREKKSDGRLYDLTDSHWNDLGAYWAYHSLIERIRQDFPSVPEPYPMRKFRVDTVDTDPGNVALTLGLMDRYREPRIVTHRRFPLKAEDGELAGYPVPFGFDLTYEAVRERPDRKDLPRALFMRDSFTEMMIRNIGDHFSKSVFIFDSWNYDIHPEIVEQEKPDLVVLIAFEVNVEAFKYNFRDPDGTPRP